MAQKNQGKNDFTHYSFSVSGDNINIMFKAANNDFVTAYYLLWESIRRDLQQALKDKKYLVTIATTVKGNTVTLHVKPLMAMGTNASKPSIKKSTASVQISPQLLQHLIGKVLRRHSSKIAHLAGKNHFIKITCVKKAYQKIDIDLYVSLLKKTYPEAEFIVKQSYQESAVIYHVIDQTETVTAEQFKITYTQAEALQCYSLDWPRHDHLLLQLMQLLAPETCLRMMEKKGGVGVLMVDENKKKTTIQLEDLHQQAKVIRDKYCGHPPIIATFEEVQSTIKLLNPLFKQKGMSVSYLLDDVASEEESKSWLYCFDATGESDAKAFQQVIDAMVGEAQQSYQALHRDGLFAHDGTPGGGNPPSISFDAAKKN